MHFTKHLYFREVEKLTFNQLDILDGLVNRFCEVDKTALGLRTGLKQSGIHLWKQIEKT